MSSKHRPITRAVRHLVAATLAVAASLGHAASQSGPVPNPYLARSYNNQTHWNDAATDSVGFALPRGNFEITPESVQLIPNESNSLPLVTDNVAGKDIYWWWAGFSLRKIAVENGKLVELARANLPVKLPDYTPITPEQRREQAAAVKTFLDAADERGLLDYMKSQPNRMLTSSEDQVRNGAIYALLGRDDTFYGCSGREVFRIGQEKPESATSGMTAPRSMALPASLFDEEKIRRSGARQRADFLLGMGMSYNGYLVLNTLGGRIVTLDRDTLNVVDVYTVAGDDELFMNGFATGPEAGGGAVYVASNTTMYRLVVDGNGKIHADEASGAWQASYDRGVTMPPPKVGDGTGSTPTLMGFGPKEDKLVVITDGARKMRLVAFWRDAIPAGWKQKPGTPSARIADQRLVDMGPAIESVQSEQSVAAFGDYAFVVNNIPTNEAPVLSKSATYVNLINGATRPGPTGVAMLKWNQKRHAWSMLWSRPDVSSISVVPMISGGGRMAVVDGYFASRLNDRYHIGLDLDTGKTVMTLRGGSDPTFNGMYAPIKMDPQGHIFYSGAFGLMRLDTTKMKRVLDDAAMVSRRH
ncbi:conserved exported hypothetical protein [Cupriavidus taiwanensis]|uniref:hypothetical protein n=1 Tax=Cupriavidus taiwanensis TaxID=164546 RepID=UPI000E19BA9C|nr:hypothetical protein [Cupriavidus taiwanensis]SPA39621.1 conserved exported hypothetical protein [Cupriavidus taiwanensis]